MLVHNHLINITLTCFLTYNNMESLFHFPTEKKRRAYEKLTTADKEKIQGILFIMDKFSISWEAYHELTQKDDTLPRSYLVEGCQATFDSHWQITKTPGNQPGAELPFKDLLKKELEEHVSYFHIIPLNQLKIMGFKCFRFVLSIRCNQCSMSLSSVSEPGSD